MNALIARMSDLPNKEHRLIPCQEAAMEIPDKMTQVLEKDGVVAIATLGQDGPHMVNTWNS